MYTRSGTQKNRSEVIHVSRNGCQSIQGPAFIVVVLCALAALLPDLSWAQLSGVVVQSRLIATTRDPVPGMPGTFFVDDGVACCAGFGQPILDQGSNVAFDGVPDGPFAVPSIFVRRAGTGLANAIAPFPTSPPIGVPFSIWSYEGNPVLDGDRVVFTGTRFDSLCDTEVSCISTQLTGIAGYSRASLEPSFVLEEFGTPLAHDGGSLLYEDGSGQIFLGASVVFTRGDTIDGFSVYPSVVPRGFGFKSGFAFLGDGFGANSVQGIWKQDTTPWGAVATTATELPGLPGLDFTTFGPPAVGSPVVGGGGPPISTSVVFWGQADFLHQGIYSGSAGVSKLADTTDSVLAQGFLEALYQFDPAVAVDGQEVAFTANNDTHVVVADAVNGDLRAALTIGDTLRFGRRDYYVQQLDMGPDSFSLGNIVLRGRLSEDPDPFAPQFDAVFIIDADGNGIGGPGSSQADPILPTSTSTDPGSGLPVSHFDDAPSVAWIDPPLASGFTYTMTGSSLFTAILDFPTGFNAPFEVLVGETSLGTFSPGTVVDFGAGVSAFTIQGIDPPVDVEDHAPFAVQLEFDSLYASFTATAVPEPSVSAAMSVALLGFALLGSRRR